MDDYYTILIDWVPPRYQTEWHPTEITGPFARLSRGAFKCQGDAIEWARQHLGGTPYTIRKVEGF